MEIDTGGRARRDVEVALAGAHADRQRDADAHAADHVRWEVARQQLEDRLSAAQSAILARADLEDALARARGELGEALATLAVETAALGEARRQGEADRSDCEGTRREAEALRQALNAARNELDRAHAADAEARATWEKTRDALEEQLAAAAEVQAAERMDWMTASVALETRISHADDELDRLGEESQALRAELDRVAARHDRLARSELFGYAVTTLDGWLVHCNDVFAQLLGYVNARDALASASERALGGAGGPDVIDAASLGEGQVRYRDASLTRVDGQSVRVLQSAVLVAGTHGHDRLVERIVVDLRDRSALEDRLRDAERLEAVGRLTVGMTPELEGLAVLMEGDLAEGPAPAGSLDEPAEAVNRTAALAEMRQLLAFARKQARPPALLDLNDAVERVSPMLARLVSSYVDFTVRLGATSLIAADEEDFEQMLTALVVAARDVLSSGGSLIVEAGPVEVADLDRRPPIGLGPGPGALLTVTASGFGVQPAEPSPALETVVRRCGGVLQSGGVTGRRAVLRVSLPRAR